MKFNKDSKVVRISAFAEGSYSGATAYGELYIPYKYYEKNKEKLKELSVYVDELDGKYSGIECHMNFAYFTIEEVLKMEENRNENRNIDGNLFDNFCDDLGLDDIESEMIEDFSDGLLGLEKVSSTEEIRIVLSKDTIVDDILIPKGTLIQFVKNTDNKILDDWEWEFDFNIE